MDEHLSLHRESFDLKPHDYHNDRLKYNDLKNKKDELYKTFDENICQPIRAKINELNLNGSSHSSSSIYNWNNSEIFKFHEESYSEEDSPEVFNKNKYVEFKSSCAY